MRRSNSSDAEIRDLERRIGQLDLADLVRLLRLYQRSLGGVEGVIRLDRIFFDESKLSPGASRIRVLQAVHAAGFSHPNPEVVALLTRREKRLAVFVATMHDDRVEMFRRRREWGFPERSWGTYSTGARFEPGSPLYIVHGDVKTGSSYHGDERVVMPSNRENYEDDEGLAKADSEAKEIEREWGPIVLLQRHPWGKPSTTGYKRWFVEHSLFVADNDRYIIRYMHFAGEHSERHHKPGVIALDYEISAELHSAERPLTWSGFSTSEIVADVMKEATLVRFEIDLLQALREHGASRASDGGHRANWTDAAAVLREILSERGGEGDLTDFMLSPSHASTAAWRGSRRFSDEHTLHGFVLGVWPAGAGAITIGVGSNLLDRRQTAIKPDRVWPELAPFPGRSSKALTRRLETWAKTPGVDKVQVDHDTARFWLETLRQNAYYGSGNYP